MDFTVIGTLHSYVQQKNLKFAANYKQKTGQTVVTSSGNLKLDLKAANNQSLVDKMIQAQQSNKDEYSKQRVSSIKQKLLNGKEISNEELGYLKKNAPELYKKAKKAVEAREELKAALAKAKTKEEARKAVTQAMIKASAEASAELEAAKLGAGGGATGINPAGYQASQDVNTANVEVAAGNSNEPAMVRLNEQIDSVSAKNDSNLAENLQAMTLKDINLNIAENNAMQSDLAAELNKNQNVISDSSQENKSIDGILEKFIMVVRAIEDEWITFSKSDDYKDLPDDILEEVEQELSGKGKHKKKISIEKPNQQVIDVVSAYRKSMSYSLP